ncbi:MAG: hypothetical protein Q8L37_00100 [Candidatus Gottesmanbacteria bacterium]|nr:hypothetical protein [Candidatus Gottesmanbacteria bacterium]
MEKLHLPLFFILFLLLTHCTFFLSPHSAQAATNVYYSVGQNTTDHKTGSPTLTISSGVGTFSVAQTATNMGVGDAVTYNTNVVAYISGKTSTSVWTLVTATGGTPADISDSTVVSIAHVFTALNTALSSATGASYLNTTNLVTGGFVLNIPCYYDSGADTTAVATPAITTGASNYINVYTATSTTSEVNQTQRHSGVWNTSKYILDAPNYSGADFWVINGVAYIRIDGLQILHDGSHNSNEVAISANYVGTASDVRISNNIIRAVDSGNGNGQGGVFLNESSNNGQNAPSKVWNNIIYGFGTVSGTGVGIRNGTNGSPYIYNNTVYGNVDGIVGGNSSNLLKNNISYNNTTDYSGTFSASSVNNLSKDATSPNAAYRSKIVVFVNAGSDMHLASSDTAAQRAGIDLSGDANLPFTTDIDGETRFAGTWDIGADQKSAPYPPTRIMRLFEGFKIKFVSGRFIIQQKQ